MGVERLAMLYYGVTDIREFYSSNLDFKPISFMKIQYSFLKNFLDTKLVKN